MWRWALAVLLLSGCGARSELGVPAPLVTPAPEGHVVGMALGAAWSWALLDDGSTWFWGTAEGWTPPPGGQLAGRTPSPPGIASFGVGRDQVCAVLHDGTLECWGEDNESQAGTNSPDGDPMMVPPTVTATGVSSVSVGLSYGCAARADGVALCWGAGSSPQIGTLAPMGEPTPTPVQGVEGVMAISVKQDVTCALVTGGAVMCWGQAPLGDGSSTPSSATPVQVQGLAGPATQVAVGSKHACALLADGTVMCWGQGDHGQLGMGTGVTSALLPQHIPGLSRVTAISSGEYHSCALLDDGTVQCWGTYQGPPVAETWTPAAVPGLADVREIASGWGQDCAILEDHEMVCWGDDDQGQLGDGNQTTSPTPILVPGLP